MEHHFSFLLPFQYSFEANLWLSMSTWVYPKCFYDLIIFCLCRFVVMYKGDKLTVFECVQAGVPIFYIVIISEFMILYWLLRDFDGSGWLHRASWTVMIQRALMLFLPYMYSGENSFFFRIWHTLHSYSLHDGQ